MEGNYSIFLILFKKKKKWNSVLGILIKRYFVLLLPSPTIISYLWPHFLDCIDISPFPTLNILGFSFLSFFSFFTFCYSFYSFASAWKPRLIDCSFYSPNNHMAVFIFLRTSSRNQTIVLESLDSYFFLYARQLQFSFDLNYFCLTDKKGKKRLKLDNPSTKNLFGTSQLLIYIKQANCRRDRC